MIRTTNTCMITRLTVTLESIVADISYLTNNMDDIQQLLNEARTFIQIERDAELTQPDNPIPTFDDC